jgi:hypothetical protein
VQVVWQYDHGVDMERTGAHHCAECLAQKFQLFVAGDYGPALVGDNGEEIVAARYAAAAVVAHDRAPPWALLRTRHTICP